MKKIATIRQKKNNKNRALGGRTGQRAGWPTAGWEGGWRVSLPGFLYHTNKSGGLGAAARGFEPPPTSHQNHDIRHWVKQSLQGK